MLQLTGTARRNLFRVLTGVGAVGGFAIHALPNTYFLNQYREITQAYRYGVPFPVSVELTTLLQEVMADMKIPEEQRSRVKLYVGFGSEFFRAGSLLTEMGGIVGVPGFYNVGELQQNLGKLRLQGKKVDWTSEAGEALKEALELTSNANKFFMGREVAYLRTAEPFIKGAIASGAVLYHHLLVWLLKKRLGHLAQPKVVVVPLHIILFIICVTLYVFGMDITVCHLEQECDREAASLDRSYLVGGIEFYEKLIKRNIALRNLDPAEEKHYTALGNIQTTFRTPHWPLHSCLDALKKMLEQQEKNTEHLEMNVPRSSSLDDSQKGK